MKEEKNEIVVKQEDDYSIEPGKVKEFAVKASKELKDIVTQSNGTVKLGNNEYLKFEAWQTVAKFFGSTVSIEWTKPVLIKDKDGAEQIFGYEAKASVIDSKGRIISSAENGCFRDEYNWKDKPSFQLRSMAQTRASAKALRQVYAWVVVLSGYQATPAEEVDNGQNNHAHGLGRQFEKTIQSSVSKMPAATPIVAGDKQSEMVCQRCKVSITPKVFEYSKQKFGKPFCINCQDVVKEELAKIPKELQKNNDDSI